MIGGKLPVAKYVTLTLMNSSVGKEPPFREDLSPEVEE
jgi:hypothetical protein